jgi:CHRD domain
MKQVLSVLALAAAMGLAAPAFAQTYKAVASGPAETPPNTSPGSSIITLDFAGPNLTVDMPFSGLVGTSTEAHIHCCTTDALTGTSPVALPFTDFPTGVTAGTYTKTFSLYDDATYDPAFLKANGGTAAGAATAFVNGINANEAYINIHTTEHPNGEIRGFVVAAPVPEPAEWAMLAGGLAGLMWLGRRRRWEVAWQR